MTLQEAIETEAARVHVFADIAQAYGVQAVGVRGAGGTDEECRMLAKWRDRFEYRSHVAYLAMLRLQG